MANFDLNNSVHELKNLFTGKVILIQQLMLFIAVIAVDILHQNVV